MLFDGVTASMRGLMMLLSHTQTTFPAKNCFWCMHFEKISDLLFSRFSSLRLHLGLPLVYGTAFLRMDEVVL
jgi:hypothetical protein